VEFCERSVDGKQTVKFGGTDCRDGKESAVNVQKAVSDGGKIIAIDFVNARALGNPFELTPRRIAALGELFGSFFLGLEKLSEDGFRLGNHDFALAARFGKAGFAECRPLAGKIGIAVIDFVQAAENSLFLAQDRHHLGIIARVNEAILFLRKRKQIAAVLTPIVEDVQDFFECSERHR
jgi:hypothetical protein